MAQGDQLTINLRLLWMSTHQDYLPTRLQSLLAVVDEAEKAGFYISYEKNRVQRAENLIDAGQSALDEGRYEIAYADLHEAYYIIKDTERALASMFVNTSQSVFFITPFLAFAVVALACTLFDGRRMRLGVGVGLYVVLFGLLHLLYPGYTTLQKSAYNPWAYTTFEDLLTPLLAVVSFLAALFVIQGLPHLFMEKTSLERLRPMSALTAAFSVAARNLKRRRLRTLLTSIFMLTSVFAFIILTSISFEYGFTIQPQPGQPPSEGFLLRKPLTEGSMPFEAIESEVIQWLRERPEAALVVPLIQNMPKIGYDEPPPPFATLHASGSGLGFNISGALGVFPSLEVQVTKMDSIIAQGRFLGDGDLNGILISEEAAEELQMGVNDTLQLNGRTFNVTGIFDSKKLEGLKDLDGASLLPQQVIAVPGSPTTYNTEYVPSKEVIIIHGETAQDLPGMVVSRVDVQTRNPSEILDLARLAVLIWPSVEAFASIARRTQHLFIGSYTVASGFIESAIPIVLVVLNVGVLMLGAVYERKREIATMSTVGLNPSHITAVFAAEALVIGLVGGSLGYFLGLTSYPLLAMFAPFGVKQKVEAIWGILALSLAIGVAVLGSALPATKASIITTPSLLKRWKIRIEEKPQRAGDPWLLSMPLRARIADLANFFDFMEKQLHNYALYPYRWVQNLKGSKGVLFPTPTCLSFSYIRSDEKIATENELSLVRDLLPGRCLVKLASKTRRGTIARIDEADVWQTANFIRSLILQYSAISAPKSKAAKDYREITDLVSPPPIHPTPSPRRRTRKKTVILRVCVLFIFIGVMITVPFNRYTMETIRVPYGRDFSPGELVMRSFNASFGQRLGVYFRPYWPSNATVMELKILDSENFRRYEAGEDFKVIYSFSGSELSYTFLVFKADTYYFVSKNIGDRETSLLYMFTRSPWYMPYIWTLGLCLIAVGVIGVIATFTLRRNP